MQIHGVQNGLVFTWLAVDCPGSNICTIIVDHIQSPQNTDLKITKYIEKQITKQFHVFNYMAHQHLCVYSFKPAVSPSR